MNILEDFRYAARALRAHPPFAVTITLILAVAIGANSAVFALVNAALLSPLPFPDPSRLVTIDQTRVDSPAEPLSIPDYRDLRDGTRTFEGMAAAFQWSANLTGGDAERIQGMKASASFFSLLRRPAAIGRTLLPEDEKGSGAKVIVLTHRMWMRRFGGSPSALGASMVLNGDAYTIVGVLPPAFITPVRDAELVAPFPIDTDPRRASRDAGFLRAIGRLRPGVSIAQARDDLDAIMARLRVDYPTTNATHLGTAVIEWRSALAARQRSVLVLLQAAVALVLLVACANVGNLFLASAIRREHEFAVRAALGASRGRRVRQVFLETAMIAAAAGTGGLLIELLTRRTLSVLAPADLLELSPADLSNPRVIAFTLGATIAATLLFGVMPALRLGGAQNIMRSGRGASPANRRLRAGLVAAEVALASMLITIAVVLSLSFARLQAVDPGFRTDHLLTVRLSLPKARYPRAEHAARFVDALRPRLLALPGVEDAAAVNVVPLNGYHATSDVWPADRPAPAPGDRPQAQYRMISPSYVRTFGVPLIAGRSFDDHDTAAGEPVVLISQTLARRYWTIADAVGRMLVVDDSDVTRQARIVGVVGDVKHYGLDAEVTPDVYAPIPQVPDATVQWLTNNMYWGLRTTGEPGALRDAFRRALRQVDSDVPASAMRTMDEALELALAPRRMNLWLVRVFAILALLLAAAGVYAVTSFSVALRRREIAIRAALGARADQNMKTVVADAAWPIVLGLAIGAAGALAAAPALRSVLYEVEPVSTGPFSLVSGTLLFAGLASATIAALPIRRIDPIEALKTEG
ncbi:MAG TPA: ABC transporter permease [Vicinamibacterales bacterium]|nr:ABC transporter permease [Vicinamibacterales bacterium]